MRIALRDIQFPESQKLKDSVKKAKNLRYTAIKWEFNVSNQKIVRCPENINIARFSVGAFAHGFIRPYGIAVIGHTEQAIFGGDWDP